MQLTIMAIVDLLDYQEEALEEIFPPMRPGEPVSTWTGEDPLLKYFYP